MTTPQKPPPYILDAMGGSYDESKYRWDADTKSLVDRYNGSSLSYANVPDPEQGTNVVTDLSEYNRSGGQSGLVKFAPGEQPFIGFPDDGETFISADPDEIKAYKDSARTRAYQGIAKVGVVVGGAALLGSMGGAGKAAAAGASDGLTPITVGAKTLAGGNAAVQAASMSAGATTASAFPTAALKSAGLLKTAGPPVSKFAKVGSFLSKNKDLIGAVLGGVGQAVAADKDYENQRDLMRERVELTSANYRGAKPAGTFRGLAPSSGARQAPSTRFEAYDDYEYRYDPAQGRIVRAPVER